MLIFNEDDVKAMLADALEADPTLRQEQRMIAALARGWISADAIGPFPGVFDDLMHQAFTIVGADAIEALDELEPGWPWGGWLAEFDTHLLESVQQAAVGGLRYARCLDVAASLDAETALEDEAFVHLQRLRETRDRLNAQRAVTDELMSLLPDAVAA